MKNKNIFKLLTAAILAAMISLAGCQKMEIVKIVGFIQGHVFDGNTNAPLDSVKVVWSVAGVKDSITATADDGFLIKNLPEGEYSIWCSKTGYTTIVYDVSIQNSNSSLATVRGGENIEQIVTLNPNLYSLTGGVKGRIYRNENGVNIPVSGATVVLDYNTTSQEAQEYYRFVPNLYQTTTDADGYFSFTNVPATQVNLRVPSYTDVNGETYSTYSDYFSLDAENNLSKGTILIYRQSDPIRLINSNAWSATNVGTDNFVVSDNITLTFNKDVDETVTMNKSGGVWLYDNSGQIVDISVTYTDNVITVDPNEDLIPGKQYNINWNVYSSSEYDNIGDNFYFRTEDNSVVPVAVSNLAVYYDYMGTGWVADYNTQGIYFSFDIVSNADYYEVFVKDTYNNTEYVKIANFNQFDYQQGKYIAWIYLPSRFDYFLDDGVVTPFSYGTIVSYKVRAVNTAGAGDFSNVVTVKDETAFNSGDLNIYNQDVSANNSAGTSDLTVSFEFGISSGQYADVSHTPTVKLYNGATEITPLTTTFTWDTHQHATITLIVPAGQDYSTFQLRVYDVNDSSGNVMDPTDYEAQTLN
ncbi:MAG: Ig-like domain-containing protein [Bacteroidales bacterium]|nr:Ig-like domain-containing protein [Bacteroidales bacterium]